MKKIISVLSILFLLFLSACSTNGEPGIASNNLFTDNSLSNTSEAKDDSNDNQQSHDKDEWFLVSCLPQDFYFKDMHFKMDTETKLNYHDISNFFGYFINLEDLEKWREVDNSNDIIYVIDNNNSIFNYDFDEKLTNRFELFLTHNQNEIALKSNGSYFSYKYVEVLQ